MKFSATFANGQRVTRTTNHNYTHAWRVSRTAIGDLDAVNCTGFAHSEENASRAAQQTAARFKTPMQIEVVATLAT